MIEINQSSLFIISGLLVACCVLQLALSLYMAASLKAASKERYRLNREMFGLLKKLEGLTSSRREKFMKHYDRLMETLTTRLPAQVASRASQSILETEKRIIARLAELEPDLNDENSKEKMDRLIKQMEALEETVVALTADTVHEVLSDGKKLLFTDSDMEERDSFIL
ncbi:MAG: hypothetical protein D6719_02325 [Candidatus Dadabacteria bacterium]|nr:MAG: hypothetical protein D6719_02325 [Candidatus Dadabacteria bacterium]